MEYALEQQELRDARQAEAEDHGFDNWVEYMQSLEDDRADADYEKTREAELCL